jgi:hypothetical protein
MVLSWILNSVSKDIAASVIYINSADDMWNDLNDRFSQKNGPRIFQLQKAISSHSQQNLTVSEYFTRLKGLWDELTNYRPIPQCSCDKPKILADHSHQDYVFQFLMGLNDSFAQIRGQILLIDPLPSINKVFSLVIQEERQREISVHPVQVETAALMTRASSQYQNQQHHNGKSSFRKDRPLCTHCGLLGHTMEKCYKLHGYPPGYKFNKNKPNTISANQVQEVDQSFQIPQLSISQEQIQQLLSLLKPSTSVSENSPSALQVGSS